MPDERNEIKIYTDGGCDPNPGGPGGYGVVLTDGSQRQEFSGGFRATTNNRMEIYAAIIGLETLKEPSRVRLYSDSSYLVKAIRQGWAKRWRKNDWMRTKSQKALNADLWEKLLKLCDIHQVKFVWVKGHANNALNERCDQLARQAAKKPRLPVDKGYENRPLGEDPSKKITRVGQPCRKCAAPVVKRTPHKKRKTGQNYYYEYYLYCPGCKTIYLVDEAKRTISNTPRLLP